MAIALLKHLKRISITHLFIEFLGTYFLVFTVGCNVLGKTQLGGISIGAVLMVSIFMGGYISGAHYNPAVTTAVLVRGKISGAEALFYIITQVFAGFAAAFATYFMFDQTYALAPGEAVHWKITTALYGEFVITFILCSVVLHTATTKAQEGNSFFGLAIGFTVVSGAISVGPISGGAFNPAVATGPAIVQLFFGKGMDGTERENVKYIWIYWVADIFAAICAGLAFRWFIRDRSEERQPLQPLSNMPPTEDDDGEYV